jgi:hypothetical protein
LGKELDKEMGNKEAEGSRMRREGEEGGRRRLRSWGSCWRRRCEEGGWRKQDEESR